MAHWNYRLVQHSDHVSMVEAHYNDQGQLYAWADAGPVIGNDVEDFAGELANRQKALDAPVIPVSYLTSDEFLATADPEWDIEGGSVAATAVGFTEPIKADRCMYCRKTVHNEMHDGHTFVIDDETGGDVCGWNGGNEPHEVGKTYEFTIKGVLSGVNKQDAWDQWADLLHQPRFVEDGTEVTEYVDEDVLRGDR